MKIWSVCVLALLILTGIAFSQYSQPVLMKKSSGVEIKWVYVATAGQCTSLWYRVPKDCKHVTVWDAAVDTSTAGTEDTLDMVWVAQASWGSDSSSLGNKPFSPFFPDSTGNGAGVATATAERVGHMYQQNLPEADTCYVQYPPFDVEGWGWIRFIGKSITATNPHACKHAVWLKFQ